MTTRRTISSSRSMTAQPRGGDLFLHPDATADGKVHKGVDRHVMALPFVRSRKRGGGRCFWSVTPTGKYSEDYAQGRAWARLVIPLLKFNVGPPLLSWIVADMAAAGERNGLVLGFMREIADELRDARQLVAQAPATRGTQSRPPVKKTRAKTLKRVKPRSAA